jgi:uncharacterized protein (TIGR03437 family)
MGKGGAYVFVRSGDTWIQQAKLIASDVSTPDHFGASVSISGDTIAVGTLPDGTSPHRNGAVYIFARSGAAWSEQALLTAPPGYFGFGSGNLDAVIALSGDTLAVGGAFDTEASGVFVNAAVFVYVRSGANWTQQAQLTDTTEEQFGTVALDGDTLAVGAWGANNTTGTVYVFVRSGTTWTQQAKLTAPDAVAGNCDGYYVAISGDTLVDGGGNGFCGRNVFYIFARSGTNWVLQSEVPITQNPDAYYDKWFAISGSTMVLGLPDASVQNAQFQGTAYVYDLPPQVSVASVVNGATFQAPVAPGALATIFGNNFAGPDTLASRVPLPTTINGVSVAVNGTPAPLIFVGSKQINFQIPYETMPGNARVVVSVNGNESAAVQFTVSETSPGIFVFGDNRANIQNQDHSLNDEAHPAKAGSFVVIWATGLGQMDHPVPTGEATPASPLSNALVLPSVTIGGINAEVPFAGLSPGFVGLAQINVKIPTLSSGVYPVVITQGGQVSNGPVMNVSK